MKVEIEDEPKPEEVGMDFRGLAAGKDGALWIFGDDGYGWIGNDGVSFYSHKEFIDCDFDRWKPFTKYNGKVTLSND